MASGIIQQTIEKKLKDQFSPTHLGTNSTIAPSINSFLSSIAYSLKLKVTRTLTAVDLEAKITFSIHF